MGWGIDYLAKNVVGHGIDVANAAMDLGSNIPGVRDQVSKMRAGIHEFEKMLTPEHRYQGTNGGDIYAWFHEGPDPQSKDLQQAVRGWNKVSEHHREAGDALNSAMSKIRANWQGQAGEGAANSTEPLRRSADTAHEHSQQAATTLQAQADGFHDTKNRVVQMDSQPPVASIKEMVTGNDRLDARVGEYTETQQANQQAFSGYGNTTSTNIQGVPNFQPAPDKPAGQDGQSSPGGQPGVGSGSMAPPSTTSSSTSGGSTSPSGVDSSGGSGVHPSQPSHHTPGGRSDSPAASQPSFHYQRPGQDERQDQKPDRSDTGAGMAGGAAGAAAGAGAIAGGSLLGSSAGGSSGGRGAGSGSGGRGALGPDAGGRSGSAAPGSGGRGALSPGGQSGSGSAPGGAVTGGGAAGARGGAGGVGAAPPAAGGRGDDKERERPDYLTEANPHEVFGLDERVAPPVFGDLNPPGGDE